MTSPRVIVAGAGPVGCVAGAVLAGRGVDVILLEAAPELPLELRASTFHPATLDLIDRFGVVEPMLRLGLVAPVFAYRDRRKGVVAEFDLGALADVTDHPYRLQCEQFRLCEILLDAFERQPRVTVRFGAEVAGAVDHGDAASVMLASGETLEADAVVAADGAASAVRKSLDLAFDGMTYEDRYLVLSTPFDMAAHLDRLAAVNYISDPDEWLVLLRTAGFWRALFPVGEGESDAQALSDRSAQRRLSGIVTTDEPFEVAHRTIYRVHQRVAETFLVGRVVLMGDAAHINNPLGGMGMNGGIHDAVLLGASLAAVLRGDIAAERLAHHAEVRRKLAIDYVRRHTHENAESLAAPDGEARQRALDRMAARAADPAEARAYMLQASMINAVSAMRDELDEVGQPVRSVDRNTVSP
ncbi:MAG: NAD(P)/FAD-dependent oxidoreductase [Acidimicrobiaceae bacterium]|nr:NAD(P)/FAD-dependent oxidoreductase [Acidimicrobiaceae bacterium]MDE0517051.1 NAD(P)/FAD-dependent oxidoreductase [Acidimicrobiaceae bacterium]